MHGYDPRSLILLMTNMQCRFCEYDAWEFHLSDDKAQGAVCPKCGIPFSCPGDPNQDEINIEYWMSQQI